MNLKLKQRLKYRRFIMSSFLDLTDERLEDAVEPKAVDDGEYTLKLVDWMTTDSGEVTRKNSSDNPYIMPIFEIIECEEAVFAKNISHYLPLLHEDMDKKEKNNTLWKLKEFFEALGIDYTQRIDYEDLIGKTTDALLTVLDDPDFGEQNRIKRFVTGR